MSTGYTTPENRRHTADVFRANWLWLVLLGAVLVAAGVVAILVPAVSTIAASKVLGSVLIVSGIVQVMQSAKMLSWIGFIWHLLLGILAAIGGALIYMDPFAGVIALTLLIAIIFAVHGATQVAFAWKVRRQPGWYRVRYRSPLFQAPSETAPIITQLPAGTRIRVTRVLPGFLAVESTTGKAPGFVSSDDVLPDSVAGPVR